MGRAERRRYLPDETRNICLFRLDVHFARLKLRQVKYVVDELEEHLAANEDRIHGEVVLGLCLETLLEHFGKADDGVEWRPYVVADGRKEQTLRQRLLDALAEHGVRPVVLQGNVEMRTKRLPRKRLRRHAVHAGGNRLVEERVVGIGRDPDYGERPRLRIGRRPEFGTGVYAAFPGHVDVCQDKVYLAAFRPVQDLQHFLPVPDLDTFRAEVIDDVRDDLEVYFLVVREQHPVAFESLHGLVPPFYCLKFPVCPLIIATTSP